MCVYRAEFKKRKVIHNFCEIAIYFGKVIRNFCEIAIYFGKVIRNCESYTKKVYKKVKFCNVDQQSDLQIT